MLSPYRVIDLCDDQGLLCGQILADLGADVIQVEPPGGSPARRHGPWLRGERHIEKSLFWWAYARGKRSVVLDPESESDRDTLLRLAAGADFFLESERPGRLAALGLGYDDLAALNPALVYVSITPFGQEGPKAQWVGTDLTLAAAGGTLYLGGEQDMPPVRVSVPQSHAHAAADAAVGALIAHEERKRSGRGQHVDVSTQQSITLGTMFRALDAPLESASAQRVSGGVQVGRAFMRSRFALKDGWVVLGPAFLPSTGHFMVRLLERVAAEGHCDRSLVDEEWGSFGMRMLAGELPPDAYEPVERALTSFFATRTTAALMQEAVDHRLLVAPILGIDTIVDSEQLASRDFLTEVHHSDAASTPRYPGPFAKFGDSPIEYRRAAPQLDEHGDEIRAEGARRPAAVALFEEQPERAGCESAESAGSGNGRAKSRATDAGPLDGVKILDLFWILAGPGATRMLADYGATVVHVESTRHIDTLRVIPPYQFSHPHVEGSGAFQSANANKLGLTLDLGAEAGREVALEFVRWADVVTESFAPGVIDNYGLGWETLREVNPDLIMISSCLMGQSGPWRDFTGFGNLAASVTGFQQIASWPDRAPSGPYGAYTDFIAVRYNAVSILAALEQRDRTGRGQYIDMSQAEAALHFQTPAVLDYTLNGTTTRASGNQDLVMHPHDVYPCVGEDRWVAIAVRDEVDWKALCMVMEQPDLEAHQGDRDAVEQALREWTQSRNAGEVAAALQARGVPAHEVLDTPGLFACPQLQQRGHYVGTEHEIYQTTTVESSRLRLARSAERVPKSALSFGRDNRAVLEEILGYTPERIALLAEQGVLL